jgi:hypothetical protein
MLLNKSKLLHSLFPTLSRSIIFVVDTPYWKGPRHHRHRRYSCPLTCAESIQLFMPVLSEHFPGRSITSSAHVPSAGLVTSYRHDDIRFI